VNKSDVKKEFGNSVKVLRGRLGISQEVLAERAGLHRTYVSDVERGARNLSLESISRLARALEVSAATLFPQQLQVESRRGSIPNDHDFVDVLLVEDNPDDAELALHAFKEARFANRIKVATDGVEALDFLFGRGQYASSPSEARPQIILLDLNLPKVSGLEVLRQIKADKRTAKLHVVVLTVSDNSCDIAECLRLGADNYIVKPVNIERLIAVTPQLKLNWALIKLTEKKTAGVRT
jgi:CheY-like chemotaxis protein